MSFKVKRILLIVSIFVVAIGTAFILGKTKPPPETKPIEDVTLLVEVMELDQSAANFTITSQGTVRPRTETVLSAEVAGSIVSVSPNFVAGGVFERDEVLMRIDPANYEVALSQAEALVRQRQIEFDGAEKLRSQGYRAESEYASAAAALASANAELVRAQRNLERTYVRLPYDGMVRAKEADLGQYVNVGSRLGVAFATDFAEVRLPLTESDLAFVDLPQPGQMAGPGDGPGATLTARHRGVTTEWSARITRTEGVVDERNRVSYAVARIDDPYALRRGNDAARPLPMGTFVGALVEGTTVEDIIRVPREALRGNSQLMFVDDENRLRIRQVEILRTDAEYAYLSGGAEAGERIILTAIESPVNGMRVRTGDDPVETPATDEKRVASGSERD
jgi:RND family efflux transporter MFP subunit